MIYELICRLLTTCEAIEVRDVSRNIAYRADALTQSMSGVSAIMDEDGREIARFRRKAFSFHQSYQIEMLGGVTRPWTSVRDRCRIDVKDERNVDMLMSLIIVLEHILMDRRESVEAEGGAGIMAESRAMPANAAAVDSAGAGR